VLRSKLKANRNFMAFYSFDSAENKKSKFKLFGTDADGKRKKLKKILITAGVLVLLLGGLFYWKASTILSKISTGNDGLLSGLLKSEDDVKGVSEGRINILLLGIRGTNMPGGSNLADTIMLVSIKPDQNKVAMISIPRDLHVEIPGQGSRKINAANALGEEQGRGKGMELIKQVVENITGVPVHYVVSANFQAFREIISTLGGVTVHLDKPFSETSQFVEGNECGGVFSLPAGDSTLNGDQALCYSRARYNTSDFDRARRQQDVLIAMKNKALSIGTLADFSKVNDIANAVGDNVLTTMVPWEMQKMYGIYQKMDNPGIIHKVFDNSANGLLYSTTIDTNDGPAYILQPKTGNFDQMKQVVQNIFDEEAVNNIIPPQAEYQQVSEPKTQQDLKKDLKKKNENSNGNTNSSNSNSNNSNSNVHSQSATNVNGNKNSNSNSNKNSNGNKNSNSNKNDNKKKKN